MGKIIPVNRPCKMTNCKGRIIGEEEDIGKSENGKTIYKFAVQCSNPECQNGKTVLRGKGTRQ